MNQYLLVIGGQKTVFEYLNDAWISNAVVEKYL